MATVRELLRDAMSLPGESPRRDAEVLLGHCLGKPRSWLFTWPESPVDDTALQQFNALLQRRARGEPVAHLTGFREFWSLELEVDASTLIPRPDTETLVAWALGLAVPADAAVLDLGTGTGAIALALACERPGWRVTAIDASAAAVTLAQRNARRNRCEQVRLLQSDWFAALRGERFGLVVANPPYVAGDDPHLGLGDLRFEPASALVADEQGLADLRRIIAAAPDHLAPGGWLLLEHGFEQAPAVRELLAARGFRSIETRRDLAGQERISGGLWHAE